MVLLQKLYFVALLLILFSEQSRAQAGAGFHITATIVNPVGLMSSASFNYTDVEVKKNKEEVNGKGSTGEITLADFNIDAAAEDVYSITLPAALVLGNDDSTSCINAVVNPGFVPQRLLNGQNKFTINSALILNNDQERGKYSTEPYEVTVNFN